MSLERDANLVRVRQVETMTEFNGTRPHELGAQNERAIGAPAPTALIFPYPILAGICSFQASGRRWLVCGDHESGRRQ
jgi:hypothetical protein